MSSAGRTSQRSAVHVGRATDFRPTVDVVSPRLLAVQKAVAQEAKLGFAPVKRSKSNLSLALEKKLDSSDESVSGASSVGLNLDISSESLDSVARHGGTPVSTSTYQLKAARCWVPPAVSRAWQEEAPTQTEAVHISINPRPLAVSSQSDERAPAWASPCGCSTENAEVSASSPRHGPLLAASSAIPDVGVSTDEEASALRLSPAMILPRHFSAMRPKRVEKVIRSPSGQEQMVLWEEESDHRRHHGAAYRDFSLEDMQSLAMRMQGHSSFSRARSSTESPVRGQRSTRTGVKPISLRSRSAVNSPARRNTSERQKPGTTSSPYSCHGNDIVQWLLNNAGPTWDLRSREQAVALGQCLCSCGLLTCADKESVSEGFGDNFKIYCIETEAYQSDLNLGRPVHVASFAREHLFSTVTTEEAHSVESASPGDLMRKANNDSSSRRQTSPGTSVDSFRSSFTQDGLSHGPPKRSVGAFSLTDMDPLQLQICQGSMHLALVTRALALLQSLFMQAQSSRISLRAIQSTFPTQYNAVQTLGMRLRRLSIDELLTFPETVQTCFWVNLYHVISMHGLIDLGHPLEVYGDVSLAQVMAQKSKILLELGELSAKDTPDGSTSPLMTCATCGVAPSAEFSAQRVNWFERTVGYTIGGHFFSLLGIEHGILRVGARVDSPSTQLPFRKDALPLFPPLYPSPDPRHRCVLSAPADPRYHFALSRPVESSPVMRLYTPDDLHKGIISATQAFLRDHVQVSYETLAGSDPPSQSMSGTIGSSLSVAGLELESPGTSCAVEQFRRNSMQVAIPESLMWYRKALGRTDADVVLWLANAYVDSLEGAKMADFVASNNFSTSVTPYNWTVSYDCFVRGVIPMQQRAAVAYQQPQHVSTHIQVHPLPQESPRKAQNAKLSALQAMQLRTASGSAPGRAVPTRSHPV